MTLNKIRCSSALEFLPAEGVKHVYEELIDEEEIVAEFITPLAYIGVVRRCGGRRRREPPLFPITAWNVNQCILQALPEQIMLLVRFYFAINCSASGAHLNIWKLMITWKKWKSSLMVK